MPYYPKEYALRELTQLYSFTGLKVIQNHTEKQIDEQHNVHHKDQIQKQTTTQNNTKTPDPKIPQKERKNRKMIEKILQEQVEKSQHGELSRLRNQPRKNYKTFIPQSKILKKVEFQKQV